MFYLEKVINIPLIIADDDSASTSPAADLALHSPYWFPVKALVQANDKLRVSRFY